MQKLLMVLMVAGLMFAAGCQKKPIKAFNVSIPQENTVDFNVELDQEYNLDLGGNIDIMQYGNLYFNKPTEENGTVIGVSVHTNAFLPEEWANYEPTDLLPNGEHLPSYVSEALVRVNIPPAENNYVTPYAYFGINGDYWLGVALELNVIEDGFPEGLSISQVFYNDDHQPIVGGSFYGPRYENGEVAVPGGLFIVANLSNVFRGSFFTESGLEIGFDKGSLSNRELYEVNKKIKKALKKIK